MFHHFFVACLLLLLGHEDRPLGRSELISAFGGGNLFECNYFPAAHTAVAGLIDYMNDSCKGKHRFRCHANHLNSCLWRGLIVLFSFTIKLHGFGDQLGKDISNILALRS